MADKRRPASELEALERIAEEQRKTRNLIKNVIFAAIVLAVVIAGTVSYNRSVDKVHRQVQCQTYGKQCDE
jgi:hypothetical protein